QIAEANQPFAHLIFSQVHLDSISRNVAGGVDTYTPNFSKKVWGDILFRVKSAEVCIKSAFSYLIS
ncbi:MAG: hypothetical protein Greene041679_470, partial [Parcubacteria group bacterium Greene0416_79]